MSVRGTGLFFAFVVLWGSPIYGPTLDRATAHPLRANGSNNQLLSHHSRQDQALEVAQATTVNTIPVADGLYMLTSEGSGNVGVSVGEDGVFIIDSQFANLSANIKAAIAQLSDQPIRFLFNTHWHGDHVGGNENFATDGALVVAHDNVRRRMKAGQVIPFFQSTVPPAATKALPVVTFNDKTSFHMNGFTIQAQHVNPSHTDGDAILYFKEADVIHTGDVYFNGIYPFIDTSSGGSLKGMIAAVETVLELSGPDTKIIPGHGPLSNKAELEVFHQMLTTLQDRSQAIAQGQTLEAFIASKPLAEFEEQWGKGFLTTEAFLTLIHQSLSNDAP